ncbi:hypothetical protein BJ742DRAFT_775044 [Cladochytrium replicatum]|nr:hypothetical protein BJ742DRAFT_775044 [Cladochytrium replicatum]
MSDSAVSQTNSNGPPKDPQTPGIHSVALADSQNIDANASDDSHMPRTRSAARIAKTRLASGIDDNSPSRPPPSTKKSTSKPKTAANPKPASEKPEKAAKDAPTEKHVAVERDRSLLLLTILQSRQTWLSSAFDRCPARIPETPDDPPANEIRLGRIGASAIHERPQRPLQPIPFVTEDNVVVEPLGSATITIGPHIFVDTRFFRIVYPPPAPKEKDSGKGAAGGNMVRPFVSPPPPMMVPPPGGFGGVVPPGGPQAQKVDTKGKAPAGGNAAGTPGQGGPKGKSPAVAEAAASKDPKANVSAIEIVVRSDSKLKTPAAVATETVAQTSSKSAESPKKTSTAKTMGSEPPPAATPASTPRPPSESPAPAPPPKPMPGLLGVPPPPGTMANPLPPEMMKSIADAVHAYFRQSKNPTASTSSPAPSTSTSTTATTVTPAPKGLGIDFTQHIQHAAKMLEPLLMTPPFKTGEGGKDSEDKEAMMISIISNAISIAMGAYSAPTGAGGVRPPMPPLYPPFGRPYVPPALGRPPFPSLPGQVGFPPRVGVGAGAVGGGGSGGSRAPRSKVDIVFEFRENRQERWLFPRDAVLELRNNAEPYEAVASFYLQPRQTNHRERTGGKPRPQQGTMVRMEGVSARLLDALRSILSDPLVASRRMVAKMAKLPPFLKVMIDYDATSIPVSLSELIVAPTPKKPTKKNEDSETVTKRKAAGTEGAGAKAARTTGKDAPSEAAAGTLTAPPVPVPMAAPPPAPMPVVAAPPYGFLPPPVGYSMPPLTGFPPHPPPYPIPPMYYGPPPPFYGWEGATPVSSAGAVKNVQVPSSAVPTTTRKPIETDAASSSEVGPSVGPVPAEASPSGVSVTRKSAPGSIGALSRGAGKRGGRQGGSLGSGVQYQMQTPKVGRPQTPAAAAAESGRRDEAEIANEKQDNDASAETLSPGGRTCMYCKCTNTPMWRRGPDGFGTLCNACGVKWKSGRILVGKGSSSSPRRGGGSGAITPAAAMAAGMAGRGRGKRGRVEGVGGGGGGGGFSGGGVRTAGVTSSTVVVEEIGGEQEGGEKETEDGGLGGGGGECGGDGVERGAHAPLKKRKLFVGQ